MSAEIVAAFRRYDAAWRGKDWRTLEEALSERVVFLSPRFSARLEGLAACIDSVRGFFERCTLLEYQEIDLIVDKSGPTAVATHRWRMRWRSDMHEQTDTGRDILIFADEAGVWRVVWRIMIEDHADSGAKVLLS